MPIGEPKRFAKVTWSASDVQSRKPDWTKAQAEEFLQTIERRLQERMIETGWDVLDYYLSQES